MGFVVELAQVRERLTVLSQRFEPDTISAADAERVLEEVRRISNVAHTLTRSAAARAADVGATRDGERDRDAWAGRKTGKSRSKARAERQTEERLKSQPGVAAAARSGELSPEQTEAIAAAVEANPGAEADLLGAAGRLSLPELQDACRKARAAADPDPEATYKRLRGLRKLVMWGDVEGVFRLLGQTTGDDATIIRGALDQLAEELSETAIAEGRHEPREAHTLDALVLLCQRYLDAYNLTTDPPTQKTQTTEASQARQAAGSATHPAGQTPGPRDRGDGDSGAGDANEPSGGTPEAGGRRRKPRRNRGRAARYLGIVRIDLAQLAPDNHNGSDGPVVEIAGVGQVPLEVARRLLGDGIVKLVITKGVDVLNVTHVGRGPSAAQQIALLWAQPTCKVTGCPLGVYEWDHRQPWAHNHITELGNLDGYCKHDHDLKTYKGWALIDDGPAKVLVPPTDPRHPNHNTNSEANAPP